MLISRAEYVAEFQKRNLAYTECSWCFEEDMLRDIHLTTYKVYIKNEERKLVSGEFVEVLAVNYMNEAAHEKRTTLLCLR